MLLIAVPVLLVNPFYTACQNQATAYSQPLLPVQFVDNLVISLGLTLYTGIRLYVVFATILLVAGWLFIGSPDRRKLWLAAIVLFVLGLLILSATALNTYTYLGNPTRLRTLLQQTDMPKKEFYTPDEAAAKIWQFANPISAKLRADFQWPVFELVLVHVLARFVWRCKGMRNPTKCLQ